MKGRTAKKPGGPPRARCPARSSGMIGIACLLLFLISGPAAVFSQESAPSVSVLPDKGTPLLSRPDIGFATPQKLQDHFQKHGKEFGEITREEYLRMAQELRDRPAGREILEAVRRDGVMTRFDRKSGAFLACNPDGTIRTFFKPKDGEKYFRRQARRNPGRSF